MTDTLRRKPVLLTGATGFVGSHLHDHLVARGYQVRCASRSPGRAQARWPERHWVEMNVEDRHSVRRALGGCGAAFYLIHRMSEANDYDEQETSAALGFADAAADAGLERIVYLGGVKPPGEPSRHLKSRLVTGALLRGGRVPTVELRASIILGEGSASWKILRDIAVRLPVMLLPSWLRHRTQPVAIDDVVVALAGALEIDLDASTCFDIPGPETLSFAECIVRVARLAGNNPRTLRVPFLTPRLSSYWLRFVSGANFHLAQELVEGLRTDLLASNDDYWQLIGHTDRLGFDEAARRALSLKPAGTTRTERIITRLYRDEPRAT